MSAIAARLGRIEEELAELRRLDSAGDGQESIMEELPTLFPLQQSIYDDPARFKVLACGRRFGKTTAAKVDVIKAALAGFPCAWISPGEKAMTPEIDDIEDRLRAQIISFNRNHGIMRLVGGGSIEFITVGDSKRPIARGRKYKVVVIDEAAFIAPLERIFVANVRPALTDLAGRCWFLSSPQGKNDFNVLFIRGGSAGKTPVLESGWLSWQAKQADNPHLPPEEVAANMARTDPLSRQEFHAEFLADGTCPFEAEALEAICVGLSGKPAVVFGVDLASRRDFTVCVGLDEDGRLAYFSRFKGAWSTVRVRVLEVVGKLPTLIDETGVGTPVVEEMQATHGNIHGYQITGSSRRDLLDLYLAAINERKTTINEEIKAEAEQFGIGRTPGGQQWIGCPEHLHDDTVFAHALAWWHRRYGRGVNIQLVGPPAGGDVCKTCGATVKEPHKKNCPSPAKPEFACHGCGAPPGVGHLPGCALPAYDPRNPPGAGRRFGPGRR